MGGTEESQQKCIQHSPRELRKSDRETKLSWQSTPPAGQSAEMVNCLECSVQRVLHEALWDDVPSGADGFKIMWSGQPACRYGNHGAHQYGSTGLKGGDGLQLR